MESLTVKMRFSVERWHPVSWGKLCVYESNTGIISTHRSRSVSDQFYYALYCLCVTRKFFVVVSCLLTDVLTYFLIRENRRSAGSHVAWLVIYHVDVIIAVKYWEGIFIWQTLQSSVSRWAFGSYANQIPWHAVVHLGSCQTRCFREKQRMHCSRWPIAKQILEEAESCWFSTHTSH